MTVLFAGGGTGGHLYPAIAIADALRQRGASAVFVGTADRLEATIVPAAGYPLHAIASRPLSRRVSLGALHTVAANVKGTLQSLRLLSRLRPDLIVATGGYVCFPLVLAARIRRLARRSGPPVALLEPNASPGLTNRLLAPIVDDVWHDVPIRSALRVLPERAQALSRLGLDRTRQTLLAMGGSQGARTINDALLRLLATGAMPAGWQVVHLTGRGEYDRVQGWLRASAAAPAVPYVVLPYLDDMADAYAAADLVLTRAGASTLGELAALGKPAIVVPYPYAAEAHQAANAERFATAGAAVVLTNREVEENRLPAVLRESVRPERLAALARAARGLQDADPLTTILARIESLVPRKNER